MTQDEIIRMAREAGFKGFGYATKNFERFAALVAAHEREACAKVCDKIVEQCVDDFESGAADECASAIRARGEK